MRPIPDRVNPAHALDQVDFYSHAAFSDNLLHDRPTAPFDSSHQTGKLATFPHMT